MTYPSWPLSLPHAQAVGDNTGPMFLEPLETEMEGGDIRRRRRPGDDLVRKRLAFRFTAAEVETWSAFVRTTLHNGASRFLMPIAVDGGACELRVVQIIGAPSYDGRAGVLRLYSLEAWVFPAEMVPPPRLTVVDTLIIGRADLDPAGTIVVDIDGVERSTIAVDGVFLLDVSYLSVGTHAIRVRYSWGAYSAPITRTVAVAYAGPFDAFAASLYSLHALARGLTSWLGPVVRARRFDGVERDFYSLTAAPWLVDVDGLGIAQWSGIGASYAARWYDQSGQGRHAVQTIAAAQPRLVAGGVLDVGPNGRPAMVLDGSNDCLRVQGATGFSQAVDRSTVAVMANVTNGGGGPWVFCDVWSDTLIRTGLQVQSASVARFGGRRDGGASAYAAGATAPGWRAMIGRIDYLGATADITVDGVTTSAAFLPPGALSNAGASSAAPTIGGANTVLFMAGMMGAVVLARAALDPATLNAALNQVRP